MAQPEHASTKYSSKRDRVWWLAASVTAINALTSAGFSVAALLSTVAASNEATHIASLYAAARSLPLAIAALWLVVIHSRRGLGALAAIMAAVQACDAMIGLLQHEPGKTIGPAVFALATVFAARALLRAPKKGQTANTAGMADA